MIRTILTPLNTELHLAIPKEYVGKQVEVLLYTSEEVQPQANLGRAASSMRGKLNLTDEQLADFHQHIKQSRDEWK